MKKYWRLLSDKDTSIHLPLLLLWITVLPLFCYLQLHWFNRLRDADVAEMERGLRLTTEHFANELNQSVRNFQQHWQNVSDNPDILAHRMRTFREQSAYPEMLDALYRVERVGGNLVLKQLTEDHDLVARTWPEELVALRQPLEAATVCPATQVREVCPKLQLALGAIIAGEHDSWTIIQLDRDFMEHTWLPSMVGAFYYSGQWPAMDLFLSEAHSGRSVYRSRSELARETMSPDLQASLFSLHESDAGRWQLAVQHRKGSLLAAANISRDRNLVIGWGLTLLMGCGLFLQLLMLQRSRAVNRRQLAWYSGISHDLRAPLSVITSAAYNLSTGIVSDNQRVGQYGHLIASESSRLRDMIEHALEYSRAHADADSYHMEELSAPTLIEEVIEDHAALLRDHQVTLDLDTNEDTSWILGDRRALKSALSNLITNAAKYGNGQWLGVRLREYENQLRIEVSDHGAGIPSREIPKLFKAYYRAEAARHSTAEGSGLGLNMVKRIMQRHQGDVGAVSQVGEGSTFFLCLPTVTLSQIHQKHSGGITWKRKFSLLKTMWV